MFTTLRFCRVFAKALFKNLCPDKKLNKTEEEEIYAELTIFLRDIESAQCIQIFFSVSSSRMYHVTIIAVK